MREGLHSSPLFEPNKKVLHGFSGVDGSGLGCALQMCAYPVTAHPLGQTINRCCR